VPDGATDTVTTAPPEVPLVWGNVPQRNKNFTGREELLARLRRQVTSQVQVVLPHALHGMGGVGKTQLAIEYAYRFMGDYKVVWWIPADQISLVKSSLAALAPRLGIDDIAPGRVDDAVSAALNALRLGGQYERWLVIFDNADEPEEIRNLLPTGNGDVIVTSRNFRWESQADVVEVDVFTRQESVEFLERRLPSITPADADRLADELGDLPLALEQAAALQVQSNLTVDEYLDLLAKESSRLLADRAPADYPEPVAAAWSLSVGRLKERMPFAWDLLRRYAFFGPEPIEQDLLKNGRFVLGPPLQEHLDDLLEVSQATRELGRYALARIDNSRNTVQVHRLIQRLIRDEMEAEESRSIRHDVHLLLAAADPNQPTNSDKWPAYDMLLAHFVPSETVECRDPRVRQFVCNIVSYLFQVGDLRTSERFAQQALEHWTGEAAAAETAQDVQDDKHVLILSQQYAELLWTKGEFAEAHERRMDTLERMRRVFGDEHEETLRVRNGYGADLRAAGDFRRALEFDDETLDLHNRVFGDEHPRTFDMANNVAIDQGLNSRYDKALATDKRTHQDRLDYYGRNDVPRVIVSQAAIASDLRQAGRYQEALDLDEQAYVAYSELVRRRVVTADHPWVLWQAKDLAVVRRKMGQLDEALGLAQEVHDKFVKAFGANHPDTLAAAMNLGNARRVKGDYSRDRELLLDAARLIESALAGYGKAYGEDHPYTLGCSLNLAIVQRRVGLMDEARELLESALDGLQRRLGEEHHYTLTCMTALATSLAETGDIEQARDLGRRALDGLRDLLGEDHPHTLACAVNLAIDLKALGETEESEALMADALKRYRQILPEDHFDVQDAAQSERIAVDFEPPLL
jgi:tetratricopeptide (TPR) repeat protein